MCVYIYTYIHISYPSCSSSARSNILVHRIFSTHITKILTYPSFSSSAGGSIGVLPPAIAKKKRRVPPLKNKNE